MKRQQIKDTYKADDIIYEDPVQEQIGTLNSFVELESNQGHIYAPPKTNRIVKATQGIVPVQRRQPQSQKLTPAATPAKLFEGSTKKKKIGSAFNTRKNSTDCLTLPDSKPVKSFSLKRFSAPDLKT